MGMEGEHAMTLAAVAVILLTLGQALFVAGLLTALPVLRTRANRCLAGAVVCLAVSGLADATSALGQGAASLRLIALGLFAEAAAAPLLYLHLTLLEENRSVSRLPVHIFGPAAILGLLLPVVFLPDGAWDGLLAGAPPQPGLALATLMAATALIGTPLLQAFYLAAAGRLWWNWQVTGPTGERRRAWAGRLLLGLGLVWLISLAAGAYGLTADAGDGLISLADLIFGLVLNALIWLGLATRGALSRASASLSNTVEESIGKYRRSGLTEERARDILTRARGALVDKRLFADPTLTLARLAKRLGVTPNELSQAINQTAGLRFNDFINQTRIEEAKLLLASPARAGQTIIDIAYEVGFNSKSTFNAAFVKATGSTPSDYRRGAAMAS